MPATFNARAETVADKPMFRDSVHQRSRCLIPTSGYYEWRSHVDGQAAVLLHELGDGSPLTIAGLWELSGRTPRLACR